jgi:phage terminase Nu1 subunit (DNA packaging protein)
VEYAPGEESGSGVSATTVQDWQGTPVCSDKEAGPSFYWDLLV